MHPRSSSFIVLFPQESFPGHPRGMDSLIRLPSRCWILACVLSLSTPGDTQTRGTSSLSSRWGVADWTVTPGPPTSLAHLLRPGPRLLPETSLRGAEVLSKVGKSYFSVAHSPLSVGKDTGSSPAGHSLAPRAGAAPGSPVPFPTLVPPYWGQGYTLTASATLQRFGARNSTSDPGMRHKEGRRGTDGDQVESVAPLCSRGHGAVARCGTWALSPGGSQTQKGGLAGRLPGLATTPNAPLFLPSPLPSFYTPFSSWFSHFYPPPSSLSVSSLLSNDAWTRTEEGESRLLNLSDTLEIISVHGVCKWREQAFWKHKKQNDFNLLSPSLSFPGAVCIRLGSKEWGEIRKGKRRGN